jgi:hypothetical protein
MRVPLRLSIITAALLLPTGAALAVEDGASYPGLMCQPVGNGVGIQRDIKGRLTNVGAAAVWSPARFRRMSPANRAA